MKLRLNSLREKMLSSDLDGVIIGKPENRMYLSGFTGSSGLLIISQDSAILITDFRYDEQAKAEAKDYEVVRQTDGLYVSLKDVIAALELKRLGFEGEFITYHEFMKLKDALPEVELIAFDGGVEELRSVKDPGEINAIKEAIHIADLAFDHMCSFILPGMTEKEVVIELEYTMKKNGSQGNSFPPIVASGPRASLPHAQPTDRKIQIGDMVKMDYGAKFSGYCSDLTRTVFVQSVSKRQKEIYNIVLEAQMAAIDEISAGRAASEIDGIARSYISKFGFGEYFGHSLGHGVGLYIHELPRLAQTSKEILQTGNIVTVEPGIYIPQWGGVRIEDMILVQDSGYINLTHAGKDLIVI